MQMRRIAQKQQGTAFITEEDDDCDMRPEPQTLQQANRWGFMHRLSIRPSICPANRWGPMHRLSIMLNQLIRTCTSVVYPSICLICHAKCWGHIVCLSILSKAENPCIVCLSFYLSICQAKRWGHMVCLSVYLSSQMLRVYHSSVYMSLLSQMLRAHNQSVYAFIYNLSCQMLRAHRLSICQVKCWGYIISPP